MKLPEATTYKIEKCINGMHWPNVASSDVQKMHSIINQYDRNRYLTLKQTYALEQTYLKSKKLQKKQAKIRQIRQQQAEAHR